MERALATKPNPRDPKPEPVHEQSPWHEDEATEAETPMAASACFLLASLAGAAILVWWALEFHHSNEQLWMVPVGLIMLGTPVVACFSVAASVAWRRLELLLYSPAAPEEAAAFDPEK